MLFLFHFMVSNLDFEIISNLFLFWEYQQFLQSATADLLKIIWKSQDQKVKDLKSGVSQ